MSSSHERTMKRLAEEKRKAERDRAREENRSIRKQAERLKKKNDKK